VRLVGGTTEGEGYLEICYGEEYGTICAGGLNLRAADVVCRQLGYSSEAGTGLIGFLEPLAVN
jgi:hypothetical protein